MSFFCRLRPLCRARPIHLVALGDGKSLGGGKKNENHKGLDEGQNATAVRLQAGSAAAGCNPVQPSFSGTWSATKYYGSLGGEGEVPRKTKDGAEQTRLSRHSQYSNMCNASQGKERQDEAMTGKLARTLM